MENIPALLLKNVALSNWAVAIPTPLNMFSSGITGTSGVPCSSSWSYSVCAAVVCGEEEGSDVPLIRAPHLQYHAPPPTLPGVSRPSTVDVHHSCYPHLTVR
uniref:Uncharacterized protein n=1 Tax=Cacopsylla melanoneura TaxID=428564 RepID=A0A8D9ATD2_9HEMI